MNMDYSILRSLGLKEKESTLYVTLLKDGPLLANQLAKNVGILRSSVYDYLDTLLDKGFITYTIQSNKKYFQAIEPGTILTLFNEKQKSQQELLKKAIEELRPIIGSSHKKFSVQVYTGKDGMKTAMSRILDAKPKDLLIYGSSGVSYKLIPAYMDYWHKERKKRGIFLRIIYNNTPLAKERLKNGPKLENAEHRFYQTPTTSLTGTIVYRDFVVITIWDMENPVAIEIENKTMANSYQENFEVLWKGARR